MVSDTQLMDSPSKTTGAGNGVVSFFRRTAMIAVLFLIGWLIARHQQGSIKGLPIPFLNVVSCIVVATATAVICLIAWRRSVVPFIAGLAGVFGIAGTQFAPYGGVLGFLIGCFVLQLSYERSLLIRKDANQTPMN
jgi:uncharacterized membrane protein YhdT